MCRFGFWGDVFLEGGWGGGQWSGGLNFVGFLIYT